MKRNTRRRAPLDQEWRTSSRSEETNCVQVRRANGRVEIRNSRDPAGGTVRLTEAAWAEFLRAVADGAFDEEG